MDKKDICDTVKAATNYLNDLKNLNEEIENAEQQILVTYHETETNIKERFNEFRTRIIHLLNKRESCLLDEAEEIRNEGVAPLEQCRKVILEKIGNTQKLLEIGDSLLMNGTNDSWIIFNNESCLLGSLPEVPELKQVPYISFQTEMNVENELEMLMEKYGEVSRIAPIQISQIVEKPGALLIEWQTIENDDKITDIQCFKLQRSFGDSHSTSNFFDCYVGIENQYLCKDLTPNQPYSFRVSCKFEGTSHWSPWSLIQTGQTTLPSFSWMGSKQFKLCNDNKIACPLDGTSAILYSDGPQFTVGNSVEFTFLEVDSKADCYVGLLPKFSSITTLDSCNDQSFLIKRNGRIFVDGIEKSTVLPEFCRGLKVCFTCDSVGGGKVRIHIDSNDKRVTYDWLTDDEKWYFIAQFFSNNWKILVE